MEFNSLLLTGLVSISPRLLFWIVIAIISLIVLGRSGKKAEHYIFIGIGLKLVSVLLAIPSIALVPWLVQNGYDMKQAVSLSSGYSVFSNVISMAGIICFVYAFMAKFNEKITIEEYE
jgi:hypothetical protein